VEEELEVNPLVDLQGMDNRVLIMFALSGSEVTLVDKGGVFKIHNYMVFGSKRLEI
jgi:hypothetical protein